MPSIIHSFGERPQAKCAACGAAVVLVTASHWKTHPENEEDQDFVEPSGETSGHYCPACNVLTAVFIHTPELKGTP